MARDWKKAKQNVFNNTKFVVITQDYLETYHHCLAPPACVVNLCAFEHIIPTVPERPGDLEVPGVRELLSHTSPVLLSRTDSHWENSKRCPQTEGGGFATL